FRSSFGGLWATHPPLAERIRAIEPNWDGKFFDPPEPVDITRESFAAAGFSSGQRYTPDETFERVQAAAANLPPPVRPVTVVPFRPAGVGGDAGALTDAPSRQAAGKLESIRAGLREAARDPESAQVVVYGLLLGSERTERDRQQELVARHAGPEAAAALAA